MPDKKEVLPYPHWRIKRILLRDYHYRLERIPQGYKANRRPGYHQIYRIINDDTDETVIEKTNLNALREVLTQEGYPLKEKDEWDIEAQIFLEIYHMKQNETSQ